MVQIVLKNKIPEISVDHLNEESMKIVFAEKGNAIYILTNTPNDYVRWETLYCHTANIGASVHTPFNNITHAIKAMLQSGGAVYNANSTREFCDQILKLKYNKE